MKIPRALQEPFVPSHENVRALELHRDQEQELLAAGLRRAFSAIVAGNVKEEGIRAIEEHGLFEIAGDPAIMKSMEKSDEEISKLVSREYLENMKVGLEHWVNGGRSGYLTWGMFHLIKRP